MKFWTSTFIVGAVIFFFIHTVVLASDKVCPPLDSPEVAAVKYQLFAAYQTGFDGYEIPCEARCLGKGPCIQKCQTQNALRLLEKKLIEVSLKAGNGNADEPCPSYTLTCIDQCKDDGPSCLKACGQASQPLAKK